MKDFFFCCCDECGSIEWIEWIKNEDDKTEERVNELTRDGDMKFKWKMDIHLYNKFSDMKISEKRFYEKKKYFNEKYEDLICFDCEKKLRPIPFSEIDKKQRIEIFFMSVEDRKNFARNYKMVKILEK
jgi:hypothetical protein